MRYVANNLHYCRTVVVLLCSVIGARSDDRASPRILIVGAGASGIAAASRLLENGFHDLVILEAEDRIGGRIRTTKFDEYVVDLGAQWVHGEKGNVAFELANPLDLIEHATMELQPYDMYAAPGRLLDFPLAKNLTQFYRDKLDAATTFTDEYSGSIGDYLVEQFQELFGEHPEINGTLRDQLLWHYNIIHTSLDPADSWYDIAALNYSHYRECDGDPAMNWKERGYSTILDVLMKKIPNPEQELPVLNKTKLNAEVVKVDYTDENGKVKVRTSNGKEYVADHVIMTPSLGVMKEQHETLFDPPLPEWKVNSIKGLGFGTAAKMFFAFDEPWWGDLPERRSGFSFLWDENERKEREKTPGTKWILSVAGFFFVQHKPRLLHCWVSGEGARMADTLSDQQLFNQTVDALNEFLSNDYNFTAPVSMIRSRWYENKHFRGTYSYRSMETERRNASAQVLSEPIVKAGKPVVLFGGEATNKDYFSTVHGAIGSGWREAERIISLYGNSAS